MALEHENSVYQAHLLELLQHEGEYVVIKADEIAGVRDSYEGALELGYDRFGPEPFLVKKIARAEPLNYFSRDLPQCRP